MEFQFTELESSSTSGSQDDKIGVLLRELTG